MEVSIPSREWSLLRLNPLTWPFEYIKLVSIPSREWSLLRPELLEMLHRVIEEVSIPSREWSLLRRKENRVFDMRIFVSIPSREWSLLRRNLECWPWMNARSFNP